MRLAEHFITFHNKFDKFNISIQKYKLMLMGNRREKITVEVGRTAA